MERVDWTVLGVMVACALVVVGYLLWTRWRDRESGPTVQIITDLNGDPYRSRNLSLEQYVRNLETAIADISTKVKSIKDEEQRNIWREYVQELRNRQLTVIQEIQDKEWRKVQQNTDRQQAVQAGIEWASNRSL